MEERYTYHTVRKTYLLDDSELNDYSKRGWHLVSCTSAKLERSDYLTRDSYCRSYMIYVFRSNNKGILDEEQPKE